MLREEIVVWKQARKESWREGELGFLVKIEHSKERCGVEGRKIDNEGGGSHGG